MVLRGRRGETYPIVFAMIERPFAIRDSVWIMPSDDIAALIACATSLLNRDDFGSFHGQIIGRPFPE